MSRIKFIKERVPIKLGKGAEKLEALGFDPVAELVELYDTISSEIFHLKHNSDGTVKSKYSMMAYASLVQQQQNISKELLRYGYARVSETDTPPPTTLPTFSITLTNYSPTEDDK